MSDFPSARPTVWTTLTHAERWEVVIQHELLGILVHQSVNALLVFACSQSNGDDRLSFTTLENGRTVNTWENVDHTFDCADVFAASPVGSLAFEDQFANDYFFEIMPSCFETPFAECVVGIRIRNHFSHRSRSQFPEGNCTILLARSLNLFAELVVVLCTKFFQQPIVFGSLEINFLSADFFLQFLHQPDHVLDHLVCEFDRFEHHVF